jgi:hypothetical protein
MNLNCIGNISYWSSLLESTAATIYLNHTFQKQSALSQYEITTATGRLKLSVPTQKSTRKGAYTEVKIDYTSNWQTEHWRSIENAYLKSPFFLYYGYRIEEVYKLKYVTLVEFNKALLLTLVACIKAPIKVNMNTTEAVYFTPIQESNNKPYPQVFDTMIKFEENVSILDLLFNLGPETKDHLLSSI